MPSPVTTETHKQHQPYIVADVIELYSFVRMLRTLVKGGRKAPYIPEVFINHARTNGALLKELINSALLTEAEHINIPASIIFWVYRGCTATGEVCPIDLPHICKLPSSKGENFFVTSKDDWMAHRSATCVDFIPAKLSDHTKLKYLARVKGIDIDALLDDFPFSSLEKSKGTELADGRYEHIIGDYIYVMAGKTCVTILNRGMVTI
jgi:hypothetical protein